jgi:predicted DNA binding protein
MRKLIIEIPTEELGKMGIKLPQLETIRSIKFHYFLRQDEEEFRAVSEIEFKDPIAEVEDLISRDFLIEAKLLGREKNGARIVMMRSGRVLSKVLQLVGMNCGHLFPPLEITDGKIKICFIGSEEEVKEFLEKVNGAKIGHRVVSLGDADFSPTSPLDQLTEKQREILVIAHKLGYYEVPRKINTEALAERTGLVVSTVDEHLRKAEQRLMTYLLEH